MNIEEEYNNKKIIFICSLLKLLPFHEWNNELLNETEKKCEFAIGYSSLLFPNGLPEIVEYYEKYLDTIMLTSITSIKKPTKIREQISLAVKSRIKTISPITHSKTAAYFALHPAQGAKAAFNSCDVIWRYTGDKSLDYNYYTKRSLLITVYISSILYYIQDESKDYIDTDHFIDKSVENIVQGFWKIKKLFNPENIPIIRMFI